MEHSICLYVSGSHSPVCHRGGLVSFLDSSICELWDVLLTVALGQCFLRVKLLPIMLHIHSFISDPMVLETGRNVK